MKDWTIKVQCSNYVGIFYKIHQQNIFNNHSPSTVAAAAAATARDNSNLTSQLLHQLTTGNFQFPIQVKREPTQDNDSIVSPSSTTTATATTASNNSSITPEQQQDIRNQIQQLQQQIYNNLINLDPSTLQQQQQQPQPTQQSQQLIQQQQPQQQQQSTLCQQQQKKMISLLENEFFPSSTMDNLNWNQPDLQNLCGLVGDQFDLKQFIGNATNANHGNSACTQQQQQQQQSQSQVNTQNFGLVPSTASTAAATATTTATGTTGHFTQLHHQQQQIQQIQQQQLQQFQLLQQFQQIQQQLKGSEINNQINQINSYLSQIGNSISCNNNSNSNNSNNNTTNAVATDLINKIAFNNTNNFYHPYSKLNGNINNNNNNNNNNIIQTSPNTTNNNNIPTPNNSNNSVPNLNQSANSFSNNHNNNIGTPLTSSSGSVHLGTPRSPPSIGGSIPTSLLSNIIQSSSPPQIQQQQQQQQQMSPPQQHQQHTPATTTCLNTSNGEINSTPVNINAFSAHHSGASQYLPSSPHDHESSSPYSSFNQQQQQQVQSSSSIVVVSQPPQQPGGGGASLGSFSLRKPISEYIKYCGKGLPAEKVTGSTINLPFQWSKDTKGERRPRVNINTDDDLKLIISLDDERDTNVLVSNQIELVTNNKYLRTTNVTSLKLLFQGRDGHSLYLMDASPISWGDIYLFTVVVVDQQTNSIVYAVDETETHCFGKRLYRSDKPKEQAYVMLPDNIINESHVLYTCYTTKIKERKTKSGKTESLPRNTIFRDNISPGHKWEFVDYPQFPLNQALTCDSQPVILSPAETQFSYYSVLPLSFDQI
ncbi:protein serine/threonine kinase [Cavenderia fasciculata]|uniref:Protein serine/threonine kinase n=1 Tax=Cavenderia fasciculata TaxID=261658 RepID=F4PK24_CACFS|nr:protein serine/threonine kinase [Cavenderia fasciculata]EGG23948.1 protein serine/threonine kinase [Cavenderia fasciculata]|eukprot:XP_004361799.1 protein serine/threonine kinase [Cavenderia fasciculata]